MNYPRRQQYRRVKRAVAAATGGVAAAGLAVLALWLGVVAAAAALAVIAVLLGVQARHWARLAGRARVGARSEEQVQRALRTLEGEGWRMRHPLPWRGRRDVDSVAIAPTGVAFAIETKTLRYDSHHLARVREMAEWLRRHRRRWCRSEAVPVLCLVRVRHLEELQDGVLVVSADRLVRALRTRAAAHPRPRFILNANDGFARRRNAVMAARAHREEP